jgi:hypothetical protein
MILISFLKEDSMNTKNDKTIQDVKQDLIEGEQTHSVNVKALKKELLRTLDANRQEDSRTLVLETLSSFDEVKNLDAPVVESILQHGVRHVGTTASRTTLLAVRNPRWWLNLAATAATVIVAKEGYDALSGAVTKQIAKRKSSAGTKSNPFADTSAAETTRAPRKLRSELSMSAVS